MSQTYGRYCRYCRYYVGVITFQIFACIYIKPSSIHSKETQQSKAKQINTRSSSRMTHPVLLTYLQKEYPIIHYRKIDKSQPLSLSDDKKEKGGIIVEKLYDDLLSADFIRDYFRR